MLDAITSQLSPAQRNLADRGISATAGALFGVVIASTAALLAGRPPFSLDPTLLAVYGSVIPLSVAGFMSYFSREAPKLPMLATLQFLALFVPGMYFAEILTSVGQLHIGGLEFAGSDFVGFRAIVVAAMSGFFFSAIKSDGTVGDSESIFAETEDRIDWQKRHDEAIRRLAMVDVDLRRQQDHEETELERFERRLSAAELAEDEYTFDLEEEAQYDVSSASLAA